MKGGRGEEKREGWKGGEGGEKRKKRFIHRSEGREWKMERKRRMGGGEEEKRGEMEGR